MNVIQALRSPVTLRSIALCAAIAVAISSCSQTPPAPTAKTLGEQGLLA